MTASHERDPDDEHPPDSDADDTIRLLQMLINSYQSDALAPEQALDSIVGVVLDRHGEGDSTGHHASPGPQTRVSGDSDDSCPTGWAPVSQPDDPGTVAVYLTAQARLEACDNAYQDASIAYAEAWNAWHAAVSALASPAEFEVIVSQSRAYSVDDLRAIADKHVHQPLMLTRYNGEDSAAKAAWERGERPGGYPVDWWNL